MPRFVSGLHNSLQIGQNVKSEEDLPREEVVKTTLVQAPKSKELLHDAVIRVYDDAGDVIETHEHKCEFKEW